MAEARRTAVAMRDHAVAHRASTPLELFFDLCFVVAVAVLASTFHHDVVEHAAGATLDYVLLFVPVWWAWMGFTWYSTAYDNGDVVSRLAAFCMMAGVLFVGASIDDAAAGEVGRFTTGYLAIRLVLVALYARAARSDPSHRRFAVRYGGGYALALPFWAVGLVVDAPGVYVAWAVAMAIELATPALAVASTRDDTFTPSHVTERYGLFTLIVLGEAVLAVARGTELSEGRVPVLVTAGAGFALACCLWWLYFDFVGGEALGVNRKASFYWGYGHLVIFSSLAATGVGVLLLVEAAGEGGATTATARWVLAGAVVAYLAAIGWIHAIASAHHLDRVARTRVSGAVLVMALAALGAPLAPPAYAVLVALVLVGVVMAESIWQVNEATPAPAASA